MFLSRDTYIYSIRSVGPAPAFSEKVVGILKGAKRNKIFEFKFPWGIG